MRQFILLFVLFLLPSAAYGEIKTIIAEATYSMGDGETPLIAESQALLLAKQIALEQAGSYLQGEAIVKNFQLTNEEIRTLTAGVLTVEILERKRSISDNSFHFYTRIKAAVTTVNMEQLANRIKGKPAVIAEYQHFQKELLRLSKEMDNFKVLLAKAPPGPERNAALDQIREREKAFAAMQQNEETFFHRLVAGQVMTRKALDEKATIDQLIQTITASGHIVEVGEPEATAITNDTHRLMVKIPVAYRVSNSLLPSIADTATALGGTIEPETEWKESYYATEKNGPVSLVRIAQNPHLAGYFQSRVAEMVLALQFVDAEGHPGHCVLADVKRTFPVDTWTELNDGTVIISRWKPSSKLDSPNAGFIALLHYEGGAKFGVLFSKEKVTKLVKISARFFERDAEKEIRMQFGTNKHPSKRYECVTVP